MLLALLFSVVLACRARSIRVKPLCKQKWIERGVALGHGGVMEKVLEKKGALKEVGLS